MGLGPNMPLITEPLLCCKMVNDTVGTKNDHPPDSQNADVFIHKLPFEFVFRIIKMLAQHFQGLICRIMYDVFKSGPKAYRLYGIAHDHSTNIDD